MDLKARLARVHLEAGRTADARALAEAAWTQIPNRLELLAGFAELWEKLSEPARALELWERVARENPALESGYASAARLHAAASRFSEALHAAENGLSAVPDSPRLHVLRSVALRGLGRPYDSLQALRESASRLRDPLLLRELSEAEELHGTRAPSAYRAYYEALEVGKTTRDELERVAARGRLVSLREGDLNLASWFEARLGTKETTIRDHVAGRNPREKPAAQDLVLLEGGISGLSFAARLRKTSSPERFFAYYSDSVASRFMLRSTSAVRSELEEIETYFAALGPLAARAERRGNRRIVGLSLEGEDSRRSAEAVLKSFGWRIRRDLEKVVVEPGEGKSPARRQDLLSALGIDEVALEEAMKSGKLFQFELHDDFVPLLFGESAWKAAFYPNAHLTGGLARVMARDPRVAMLYAGLAAAGRPAAELLFRTIGLRRLETRHAELIYLYGTALALDAFGGALVPGGREADDAWKELVGQSPRNAQEFYRALLESDEGWAIAYFHCLSQVDWAHQRFFTRTPKRLRRFYELYKQSGDLPLGPTKMSRERPFLEFLSGVPLDSGGNVRFPGSANVWMNAASRPSRVPSSDWPAKDGTEARHQVDEDEILERLVLTKYKVGYASRSLMRIFLAVAHIDRRRREPLTPTEALLLSQNFAETGAAYPYFSSMADLHETEFRVFFDFAAKARHMGGWQENLLLGHFHSVTALICVLADAGAIDPQSAASMWVEFTRRLSNSAGADDWVTASLSTLRSLERTLPPAADNDSLTERIVVALAGPREPAAVPATGGASTPSIGEARSADMRRILELQRIPSLDQMVELAEAAIAVQGTLSRAAELGERMEWLVSEIPAVPLPGDRSGRREITKSLLSFMPNAARKSVAELRRKSASQERDGAGLERIASRILSNISGPFQLAVAGLVYSHYLRASDLIVAEDPMFVRKHQFYPLGKLFSDHTRFPESDLLSVSEGAGSYAVGGFAGYSRVAGSVAAVGIRRGSPASDAVQIAQLSAVRGVPLWRLRDTDLRSVKLAYLAGREWIVRASEDPELRSALARAATGLLSATRKAALLSSIEQKNWPEAWAAVTASDLYFLGRLSLENTPAETRRNSRVLIALEDTLRKSGEGNTNLLGPILLACAGFARPELKQLMPYEMYELYVLPHKIAERVSEFKLVLALSADDKAVPALTFAAIIEPLLNQALDSLNMAENTDWSSALDAWSSVPADRAGIAAQTQGGV